MIRKVVKTGFPKKNSDWIQCPICGHEFHVKLYHSSDDSPSGLCPPEGHEIVADGPPCLHWDGLDENMDAVFVEFPK